jgi:hypothetical protein
MERSERTLGLYRELRQGEMIRLDSTGRGRVDLGQVSQSFSGGNGERIPFLGRQQM